MAHVIQARCSTPITNCPNSFPRWPVHTSFIDTVRWVTEVVPDETLTRLMVHPKRPGRFDPRVRKRRRNGYSAMTRPRSELKAMIARGEEIKCR